MNILMVKVQFKSIKKLNSACPTNRVKRFVFYLRLFFTNIKQLNALRMTLNSYEYTHRNKTGQFRFTVKLIVCCWILEMTYIEVNDFALYLKVSLMPYMSIGI